MKAKRDKKCTKIIKLFIVQSFLLPHSLLFVVFNFNWKFSDITLIKIYLKKVIPIYEFLN